MTTLVQISDRIERFSQNRVRVDLVSALAASLCVSGLVWISSTSSGDELPVVLNVKTTLVAVASYLTAALLLQPLWAGSLRRVFPSWLVVAVLGSLLFLLCEFVPASLHLWNDPRTVRVVPSTTKFVANALEDARLVYLFLCFITLPITAVVYYAGSIIRAVRRWHNGAEPPPSILGDHRT